MVWCYVKSETSRSPILNMRPYEVGAGLGKIAEPTRVDFFGAG